MSGIDYALLALVGLALGLAFGSWHKNRKAGKSCCGDCASCGHNCKK